MNGVLPIQPAIQMPIHPRMVAVVIGRNEAALLADALASVRDAGLRCVYADSGSTDASVTVAQGLADAVVQLSPDKPFSAARGRNEGLERARTLWPDADIVLFLDGDCMLIPGFVAAAVAAFDADPRRSIIVGHLQERTRDHSIYTRLAALEWHSVAGDITNYGDLGGIMAARIADIVAVGGFNPAVIAGEDSELGVRIGLSGKIVHKVDAAMAIHDAGITRFVQWWTRARRAGHAVGQRYMLHGKSSLRDCAREYKSTLFWGVGLPLFILLAAPLTHGLSLLLLGGYAVLGWRIFRHYRRAGATSADALLGARFGLFSKFANGVGLVQFLLNRARGRYQIIEYK